MTRSMTQSVPFGTDSERATSSARLPALHRFGHHAQHRLNRLLGKRTQLDVNLCGQPVSLSISNSREIRRAHAVHHEVDFIERIRSHLRDDDIVFDIGANIGVLTLLMATHRTGVSIHSFEPEPRNFRQLQENIRLNQLDSRVSAHQIALGENEGEVALHIRGHAGEGRHSIAESSGATDEIVVELKTCARFAVEQQAMPDVLKIDVEGAEGQVLAGVVGLNQSHPPRDIFLEIHSKGDADNMPDGTKIHDWFEQQNYQLMWNVERRSGEHRHYRHREALVNAEKVVAAD